MTSSRLKRDLQRLARLGEPVRRDLYLFVERQPKAVSRDEAAIGLGITRSLAAFHLDKLVEAGLLEAHFRRLSGRTGRGAGRPSKLYRRSRREVQLSVPQRHHELLGRFLVEALDPPDEMDGEQGPLGVARAYGRSLGARARRRLSARASGERLRQCAVALLEGLGYAPYPTPGGDTRLRNCPFHPLSKRYPSTVCQVGLALVGGIVEGVRAPDQWPEREPAPGHCCVLLRAQTGPGPSGGQAGG